MKPLGVQLAVLAATSEQSFELPTFSGTSLFHSSPLVLHQIFFLGLLAFAGLISSVDQGRAPHPAPSLRVFSTCRQPRFVGELVLHIRRRRLLPRPRSSPQQPAMREESRPCQWFGAWHGCAAEWTCLQILTCLF